MINTELKDIFVSMRGKYQFTFNSPQETGYLRDLMRSVGENSIFSGYEMPPNLNETNRALVYEGGRWWCRSPRADLIKVRIGDFINV